jgi:hypothetical protein
MRPRGRLLDGPATDVEVHSTGADPSGAAIDLGERFDETLDAPWRAPAWLRHGSRLLVIVLVVLGLPGSTRAAQVGLGDPLWMGRIAWDGFGLGPSMVYLPEDDATMVGRDPVTGQERWRLLLDGQPGYVVDFADGTAAIFSRIVASPPESGEHWSITVVSSETGHVYARSAGSAAASPIGAYAVAGQAVLILTAVVPGSEGCRILDGGGCTEVSSVGIPGSEQRWRLLTQPDELLVSSVVDGLYGRLDGLAVVGRSGSARLLDIATGSVTSTIAVRPGSFSGVLIDQLLVVAAREAGQTIATGYDRTSGRQRWQTRLPVAETPDGRPWPFVDECGGVVCVVSAAGTTLLDPETGAVTTTFPDEGVVRVDDGLVVASGRFGPGDGQQRAAIRQTADGALIAEVPNASFVPWDQPARGVLLMESVPAGARMLLVERSGVTRDLGRLPAQDLSCQARGSVLVCGDYGGTLYVWRLPD